MSNFREEIRQKKRIEAEEKKKKEAEEAKRKEEESNKRINRSGQERRHEGKSKKKRLAIFDQLNPMVSEILEILGDELWGKGFLIFKPYEIIKKPPDEWILSHRIGNFESKESYYDYGTYGKHEYKRKVLVKRYEGYTVKIIFSINEPKCFRINEYNDIPVSKRELEQFLLSNKPISWDIKIKNI